MTNPISTISNPTSAIDRAAAAYEWELVNSLVAEALTKSDPTPVEAYDLRLSRVEANDYIGQFVAKKDDLRIMLELAETLDDTKRQIMALSRLAYTLSDMGQLTEAQDAGELGLQLSREIQDRALEADCLCMLGWCVVLHGHHFKTIELFEGAIEAARVGDNLWAETFATTFLSFPYVNLGEAEKALDYGWKGLALSRKLADRRREVWAFINLAVVSSDLASARTFYQQAEDLANTINYRAVLIDLNNNQAMLYWRFGLYGRALAYAQASIAAARDRGVESVMSISVDTLARAAYSSGELAVARDAYASMVDFGNATEDHIALSYGYLGLGQIASDENRPEDALANLHKAAALFDDTDQLVERAITLVTLSAVHRKTGAFNKAQQESAAAIDLIKEKSLNPVNYPLQDIWWERYLVLKNERRDKDSAAWEALEKARKLMFAAIDTTGDEGLRRNYLNKVTVNRQLSEAWIKEASRRGLSLDHFTERESTPAALSAQLQRIVDSGARLAAERDTDKLAEFILNEFVELSGVERAVVALREGAFQEAPLQWAAMEGIDSTFVAFAEPFMERAASTRVPVMADSAGDVPDHAVPELHLRSVIALPLVSQGQVWGVLYGDMRHLFGRLNDNDRDILSLLANQAGAALENANWVETLEQQVAERTAEAEQANEAKSTFISNMSHELRTPLNAIIGFTRIVQRKTKDQIPPRQTDNLGKVLDSGEHLLGLINTILDIAKIEAGRMDVINSRFHIGPLIESTLTISKPLLKPSVELRQNIAPDLPEMYSDPDKIKQILLNLLSNAAKFTHEGAITVDARVGALREAPLPRPNSPSMVIEVSDTGIGMNEEAIGRVFEEFQQADATTTRQYGGTGLGLPISRHLAQLLGGDLTAESEEGAGTTFRLKLPVENEKQKEHKT